jgi:signal transduction histidine kinase
VLLSASCAQDRVRVEVGDRGPGISRELQARIFQRFSRGETTTGYRDETRGSGLGLAISKALIEGMGGRIGFETGDRSGTTFYVELPTEGSPDHPRVADLGLVPAG